MKIYQRSINTHLWAVLAATPDQAEPNTQFPLAITLAALCVSRNATQEISK